MEEESFPYEEISVDNITFFGEIHAYGIDRKIPAQVLARLKSTVEGASFLLMEGSRESIGHYLRLNQRSIIEYSYQYARCRVIMLDDISSRSLGEALTNEGLFTRRQFSFLELASYLLPREDIDFGNIRQLYSHVVAALTIVGEKYALSYDELISYADQFTQALFKITEENKLQVLRLYIIYLLYESYVRERYIYLPQILEFAKRRRNGKLVVITGRHHTRSLANMVRTATESEPEEVSYEFGDTQEVENLVAMIEGLFSEEEFAINDDLRQIGIILISLRHRLRQQVHQEMET